MMGSCPEDCRNLGGVPPKSRRLAVNKKTSICVLLLLISHYL